MAFVACMSAKAYELQNGVLTIYGSSDIPTNPPSEYNTITKIVLDGDFSSGWSGTWFNSNGSVDSKASVKIIDMKKADFTNSSSSLTNYAGWTFENFGALEEVFWPTDPSALQVIPADAFKKNGIKTIHIPGYIKLIKRDAFKGSSGTDALSNIIFDEFYLTDEQGEYVLDDDGKKISAVNMYIETYAFNETAKMTDVYINTMGTIHAENIAFPLDNTFGHADPGAELATLHFPKEKARDYANLSHELDEETANDNAKFHDWLITHFTQAGQASNGFYEFVSSGISHEDDPPISTGKFLKTFSDAEYSYIVPNGVKAYIVRYITQGTGANAGQYMLTLHRVNVIPKGTGVILYGEANSKNSKGEPTLSMTIVNYTGGAYNENSEITNYLVGTASAAGTAVHVKPYDLGSDGKTVAYRNFFLGPFSNSSLGKKYAKEHDGKYGDYPCTGHDSSKGERVNGDFVGFWRAIESDIAAGKAYLKAPASLYGNGKGSEAIVLDQTATDMNMGGVALYRAEYWLADKAYLSATELAARGFWQLAVWEKDWGVRKFNATNPVFADSFGEAEFEVDGIEAISEENKGENVYYNLQGVRVNQPTKGVYISNGKKYIFK